MVSMSVLLPMSSEPNPRGWLSEKKRLFFPHARGEDKVSKLLELAIARSRALPEAEQDRAAELLLRAIDPQGLSAPLDQETILALDEALDEAGRGEFASPAEISSLWGRRSE